MPVMIAWPRKVNKNIGGESKLICPFACAPDAGKYVGNKATEFYNICASPASTPICSPIHFWQRKHLDILVVLFDLKKMFNSRESLLSSSPSNANCKIVAVEK